jgi:hypothetical protein
MTRGAASSNTDLASTRSAASTKLVVKCDKGVSAIVGRGSNGSACVAASNTNSGPSELQSARLSPPPTEAGKK